MNIIEKTIQVLNCLSEAEASLGVTQISSKSSIPKSTVHRILSNLLLYSLVSRDKKTSKYRLGVQVLKYSNSFYNSFDLRRYSKDILKKISIKTSLTTFLSIWQEERGICIDLAAYSQNSHVHQLFVDIGKIMPFHCSASGKVLLAYQHQDELSRIVNKDDRQKYTSKTIVDKDKLIEHLTQVREQGFAICDEELEVGVRGISAPIRNINGKVIASITVTGLNARIPGKKFSYLIDIIVDAADNISKKIRYSI